MDITKTLGYILPLSILFLWLFRPSWVTQSVLALQHSLRSPPVLELERNVHLFLGDIGIPPPYPDSIDVTLVLCGVLITLGIYFLYIRRNRIRVRRELEEELGETLKLVEDMRAQLQEIHEDEARETRKSSGKETVRIFMEGAFDLMHYGHMNAFRLGAKLGTNLVVGVNSSESIEKCKGFPPVMSDDERCNAVRGCRFVDEVVEKTPYVMTSEYLDWVMKEYNIDYVVHGNDPCFVDGKDVYANVKALGKFRSIPRTEGVSTTDFVGRMLLCSALHHMREGEGRTSPVSGSRVSSLSDFQYEPSSRFHTTSSVLREFSKGIVSPSKDAKIVYMDGAWDMFHAGHIESMRRARELGDYLVIGVLGDDLVNKHRGLNYPILNLNERVMSVMGCRYVDDVVIDCPFEVDEDMIKSLNISLVVHGTIHDPASRNDPRDYVTPKRLGIYREVSSSFGLTVTEIVQRISLSRDQYLKKFKAKQAKEVEYYDERYGRKGKEEEEEEESKKEK